MSRWKAAGIHLSISIAIGLVAALLIFGLWYPPPYSRATGALELVVLLMGVDLTLGPLLTLAVFKSGKKGMAFDLAVIAVLQASAFLYGSSVVVRARPVYIVGAIDRFSVVAASDLERADLAKAAPPFNRVSWTGPQLVGVVIPDDPETRNDLVFGSLGGKDIESMPQHYRPYTDVAPAMLKRAKPLAALRKAHPESAPQLDAWLHGHARAEASVVTLPIVGHNDATMLLDAETGAPLDAIAVDPW